MLRIIEKSETFRLPSLLAATCLPGALNLKQISSLRYFDALASSIYSPPQLLRFGTNAPSPSLERWTPIASIHRAPAPFQPAGRPATVLVSPCHLLQPRGALLQLPIAFFTTRPVPTQFSPSSLAQVSIHPHSIHFYIEASKHHY